MVVIDIATVEVGGFQNRFGNAQPGYGIDDGGDRPRHFSHKVCGRQDTVPYFGRCMVIMDAGGLNQSRYVDAGRAGYLAAFAVHAIFERSIEEVWVFQTQTLFVGAALLGAGKQGINLQDRAIGGADCTLHTLFEVVLALGVFLDFHTLLS